MTMQAITDDMKTVRRLDDANLTDHVEAACFAVPRGPVIVPARTFLPQLL